MAAGIVFSIFMVRATLDCSLGPVLTLDEQKWMNKGGGNLRFADNRLLIIALQRA
jgi:hypothetical protein